MSAGANNRDAAADAQAQESQSKRRDGDRRCCTDNEPRPRAAHRRTLAYPHPESRRGALWFFPLPPPTTCPNPAFATHRRARPLRVQRPRPDESDAVSPQPSAQPGEHLVTRDKLHFTAIDLGDATLDLPPPGLFYIGLRRAIERFNKGQREFRPFRFRQLGGLFLQFRKRIGHRPIIRSPLWTSAEPRVPNARSLAARRRCAPRRRRERRSGGARPRRARNARARRARCSSWGRYAPQAPAFSSGR